MQNKLDYWQQHFESQKTSGLNFKAYCTRELLSYATFKYWHNKCKEKNKPTLIPVQITASPDVEKNVIICKLVLNYGRCLEFYDKALVKELFREVV